MTRTFKLPDLGEGIHEAEVFAVKVQAGQQVREDEVLLEVETDKAAAEIPSPFSGTVTAVNVKPGDIVHVGDVLFVFEDFEDFEDEEETALSKELTAPPVSRVDSPKETEVTVAPPATLHAPDRPVPAAPSTRRLARELGIALHAVPGSGPGGRVTAEDVRAFAARQTTPPVSHEQRAVPQPAVPQPQLAPRSSERPAPAEPIERLPLRSVRRATAKQMALAWSQIPHVSSQDVADITELQALLERHKETVRERGGALTLTVFVIKALVNALKDFPTFNASLDMAAEELVLKQYYHVGVATDSERGLLVPVLRHVDTKSVFELAVELKALVTRAREGKATLEDLQGSTITVTNIGALGSTGFMPIINYPEVAILGLAQARIQPVARTKKNGKIKFVPRLMLPLILAFDHRVNDGAAAQRFINRIIAQLEHPEQLLLGL